MILQFPNLDTFRLVLGGGLAPVEATAAPATYSGDADGRLAVETDAKLARKTTADLARLGVTVVKRHVGEAAEVSCWFQVLPVTREASVPQLSAQAPVLFELESAKDLPAIVGEMLRLGNDRQSLRRLTADAADDRVLLRVIGPPYYSLLRAIDPSAAGTSGRVRAYLEQAPRVWVQVGYAHPSAAQIRLDDGQTLLLRPDRDWLYLPDAPFQDVYELLTVRLPAGPVDWSEAESREKLTVPLRLVAGNAADLPELWVLRGHAVEQLDQFVRDADDRITQRLKFAVATDPAGQTAVVLRVTASKLDPPVLPLTDAVGYKPYFKMPNLFLPAGTRLHPPLRRDAVRKLLADDTDQLVWLAPQPGGSFAPETLPEDSFRPLEDWVDYVVETSHVPLQAWIEATRFDFEAFVCSDSNLPKPPKGPDDKDPRNKRKSRGDEDDAPLAPTGSAAKLAAKKTATDAGGVSLTMAQPEVKPPGEWFLRRQDLEKQFLDIDGPLDHPDRAGLWAELARANAGYGDVPEAALCFANALWQDGAPPAQLLADWLRAESPALKLPVTAADFEAALTNPAPTSGDARAFAALFLHAAHLSPAPAWFGDLLPAAQKFLQSNETKLPIRVVWLASSKLALLNGADTLGLARVRDRVLQRLLEEGTRPERDIPFFLRSAGLKDSDRIRQVRKKALDLHAQVRAWAARSLELSAKKGQSDQSATLGYVDLFFAYGLAKLGESLPARALVESGRQVLEGFKPTEERGIAARFLFKALRYRVEQAIAGKPHAGLLDPALIDELDEIHTRGKTSGKPDNPFGIGHYAVMRMRDQSLILEPQEKLDPYHEFMKETDDLRKALTELPKLKDANVLARQIRELYRNGVGGKVTAESRFLVLVNALPLAGRVGEPFTVELLGLVPETMKNVGAVATPAADLPEKQGKLLERGLMLAANYDRREIVQQLVDQFVTHVRDIKSDEQRYKLINVVAGRCLKSLRKLGLRDEIDRLLQRLQEVVLGGRTPQTLRQQYSATPELWGKALQSLLNLAGGWMTYGLTETAAPILDLARAELTGQGFTLAPKDFTPLAQAYVSALGQGPAETGLVRIVELFHKMDPSRVANSFTTSRFYSRFHLNLVEEVVLAVVNDDFALGPAGRRWLDEDEYLVRRRIHADLRKQLSVSGL